MDNQDLLQAIGQMMDEKLSVLDEKLTRQNNETRMIVENRFQEIKSLLKEDYGRVEKNAAKGAAAADRQKDTDSTVADLVHAVKKLNGRITDIEEKAI